jgi:hypothetical protein
MSSRKALLMIDRHDNRSVPYRYLSSNNHQRSNNLPFTKKHNIIALLKEIYFNAMILLFYNSDNVQKGDQESRTIIEILTHINRQLISFGYNYLVVINETQA